jgi:hypothetical protein
LLMGIGRLHLSRSTAASSSPQPSRVGQLQKSFIERRPSGGHVLVSALTSRVSCLNYLREATAYPPESDKPTRFASSFGARMISPVEYVPS